ncbi:MAG: alkaline phosphatase family protein [Candidatus Thorarchaeota archaeon]
MSRTAKVNQVILIIMDDVRAEHLFRLISEGRLPNIAKIADNGIKCSNCITSYPAITFPCFGNIVTGSYSGYYPEEGNAVPMYHWLNRMDPPSTSKKPPFIRNYGDRSQLLKINKDIGKNVKTIFEQTPQGNKLSSSCFLFRGAFFVTGKTVFDIEGIFKNISDVYEYPKKHFPNNEVPLISVGYIFQTDDIMHKKGFNHHEYVDLLIKCDKYLGDLINILKKTGYYDSTAIGIISDHGNFQAKELFDLEPFFEQKGLIPYNPEKGTGDFDCTFGSVGFFNFPGDSWHCHPSIKQMKKFKVSGKGRHELNLFETLWEIPKLKYMYYRDDANKPEKGVIHIEYLEKNIGKKHYGKIEYRGFGKEQQTKYIFEKNDIFQYNENEKSEELLDNKFHTLEEWLEVTNQVNFPILIDQIPRYFKNPRSCDILFSTLGECSFNYEHGKTVGISPYNHDNGLRESMVVPFIIGCSSEIPQMELKYCKTTDMVPSLLNLLGIKPHLSVVGKSVLNYK